MHIVVMGAGGVGGYFGGKLSRAGESVTMVARGAHAEAMARDGLTVRSTVEGEWVAKPEVVTSLDRRPRADAVLLCVKAFDTEAALRTIRPVVRPDTAVLTLQNGVEGPEKIDAALGAGHALGGAAYVFATIGAPGVIVHQFAGKIVFGEMDGRTSARAERLRDAFSKAGVPVELSREIRRVLWEKYLFICAQAGMSAITRVNTGAMRPVPETWRMYRMLVEELARLGACEGAGMAADVVDVIMKNAEALRPETTSSLHHDLLNGRRLELETLHGHAVRLGERHGVPTPMLFAVYSALKPHAAGRRD